MEASPDLIVPGRRLGRLPQKHDIRTLKLAKYLPKKLPEIPDVFDWSTKMTVIGPMLNDQIGDCGIAAPGHGIQSWSSLTEKEIILSDDVILKGYKDVSGYDGTPATDNGVNMLDVCRYMRTPGLGGKTIDSYIILDLTNQEHVDFACFAFGGYYSGWSLPLSFQDASTWTFDLGGDKSPAKGSWGGHAVWVVGRDKNRRTKKFVSWGTLMEATYEASEAYEDEGYVFLSSSDWAENQLAPSGFDLVTLKADLAEVTA